jgi:hypothetical protein
MIRIANQEYRVIGMAERIGNVLGQSQDNFALIPISAFFKDFGARRLSRFSGNQAGRDDQWSADNRDLYDYFFHFGTHQRTQGRHKSQGGLRPIPSSATRGDLE